MTDYNTAATPRPAAVCERAAVSRLCGGERSAA